MVSLLTPHSIHLPLVNADATVLDERVFGVIETGRPIAVAVVRHLMVIPDGDPGELLV
jgi:hypothetical protein